ncbi:MAG: ABC transporter permease [Bacteroidales bacterium]|nr:ABC transporter permease [Bacteroidales bacterium]
MRHRDCGETKNYYALIVRHIFSIIRRDTISLVTNLTGLSLGLAATILLSVFIQFELSFDRHFTHVDRIYRLNSIWISREGTMETAINLRRSYTEIPEKVAGIESAIQLYRGFQVEVAEGEKRHKELGLLYSDPDFFRIFDLKMLAGNPELALSEPGVVVLTKKAALRIFGQLDVTGRTLTMEDALYTVSGVMEDIPPNTHFRFDLLMPMKSVSYLDELGGLEFFTYYLIEEGMDPGPVLETIGRENSRLLTERFSSFEGSSFDSRLEALDQLHLHTAVEWDLTTPGSMRTIYIMLIITISVMGLALSNFINLYILNGAKRSKEIGIRKVNGAGRRQMIKQFYLETTLVVSLAFIAGTILSIELLPAFASIMQRESFTEVGSTPAIYLVSGSVFLLTILLSGFYPALLLSREAPVPLLRGGVNPAGDKKILLRAVSVVQICMAVSLLTILLGINTQIRFLKSHALGYEPENIVLISNLNQGLTGNYPAIRDKLLNLNGIDEVAASGHTIGAGNSGQSIRMYGDDPDQVKGINEYRILPGICQLYRFNLLAGRYLDPERLSDRSGVILNAEATKMLGKTPQELIGESVVMFEDPMEVIGVVEDFNYQSVALGVAPLVITAYSDRIRNIAVRISPGADPQEILSSIDETIRAFDPDYVMIHRFATDIAEGYYLAEERLQKILLSGSLLSVLIVLLGIYALVSHHMVRRTREIGIRKAMGGSTREMMILVYISTLKWTLAGSALAIPPALLYLRQWLSDYAVRIPISWWIFACSIVTVILFQTLITLGQTRRTARRNPVVALRYE